MYFLLHTHLYEMNIYNIYIYIVYVICYIYIYIHIYIYIYIYIYRLTELGLILNIYCTSGFYQTFFLSLHLFYMFHIVFRKVHKHSVALSVSLNRRARLSARPNTTSRMKLAVSLPCTC